MRRGHFPTLTAALIALTVSGLLVPATAQGAPAQMSVCVTKFDLQRVGTPSGQRYRAVTTFSGHPTFTFLSFTPGGPVLQGLGQMAFESFIQWRDFYEVIRAAAQSKVHLGVSYDDEM